MNDDELIEMANTRYRVIRTGFWWRVRIGDGQQTVGRCYTETEAQRLAQALITAFFDGAYASTRCTAEIGRNV